MKRSPILGYNHNVRYRGVVFHVQTEDSGVLSPHLFTHLFHAGVILSTRKLVYDAGSAEESIKSLMQAQHKAVLKDLRRGHFDDKIDQYLVGVEGLLPRGTKDPASRPVTVDPADAVPAINEAEAPPTVRTPIPESFRDDIPTGTDLVDPDSEPQIEIIANEPPPSHSTRIRAVRDTEVEVSISIRKDRDQQRATRSDIAQPTPPPPPPERQRAQTVARGAPVSRPPPIPKRAGTVAASVPPAPPPRSSSSRQAIVAPQVVSRPLTTADGRARETDAVEVYAPAPPSVHLPAEEQGDHPGQYAQHNRKSSEIPVVRDPSVRAVTPAPVPIPAGLGRPGRGHGGVPRPVPPETTKPAAPPGIPTTPHATRPSRPEQIPRTVTPPRTSRGQAAASGVVMTKPAVIVGDAPRPTVPRDRNTRQDEERGFGQGLISEKSLDEVILAYLSEDAEEK